jgi:HAD superfamily hydrolase (TIGR01459 family)
MTLPRTIGGLAEIADHIDGFVLDLWGVMHDGVQPYPGAIDCLENIRKAGKKAVFLSNAPRRNMAVIEQLTKFGVPRECYQDVVTSGDVAWRAMRDRDDDFVRSLGRDCLHIGPERDLTMLEGGFLNPVKTAAEASFGLITGAYTADDKATDYDDMLRPLVERGLPAICANPDLEVIRGGKREICAGAIAARFEELGGTVRYYGKPHANVLEEALRLIGVDKSRAVMVGDSFRTDIASANAAGVAGVFVARGIYAERLGIQPGEQPNPEDVAKMAAEFGVTVSYSVPGLLWAAAR